jgi:rhomboid protease GluP
LGVGLVIFFPSTYNPNVSYMAHAIGMVLGILFGFAYFFINRGRFRRAERYTEYLVEEDSTFA